MKATLLVAAGLLISGAGLGAQTPRTPAGTPAQTSAGAPPPTSAAAPAQAGATPPQTPAPLADAAGAGHSRIIERVLVRVNGEVFTETQLEYREYDALKDQKVGISSPQDVSDARLSAMLEKVTPDILVDAVDELLLVQYGREQGYHMTDDQFKTVVDGFKQQNKLTDAQLKDALESEGLTMDTWRQMIEHQSIIQDVQREEILPKAQVTQEELRQYYTAHPDDFRTPETVTLREILVAVPTVMQGGKATVNAAADEAGHTRINEIRDRLLRGEDFAKVAAEVSDSATKTKGGLLGTFQVAEINPQLKAQVDALKVGDITQPLHTQAGWQILELDARAQPELKPFDSVRDDLRQKVGSSRLDTEQDKFLVKIRANAIIDWKDPSLKAMYDKALAARLAAAK